MLKSFRTWRAWRTWTWRALLIATWAVVITFAGLFLLEESGLLAQVLRTQAGRHLGVLGEGLEIGDVRLRWFEPGITLEEVCLRAPRQGRTGGEELLRMREVHISLRLDFSEMRRIHVKGGRVMVSDRLLDGIQRVSQHLPEQDLSAASRANLFKLAPPTLFITNFSVGLEMPDHRPVEIGTIDLVARPDAEGDFQLEGRLFPKLAGAVRGPAAVQVIGGMHGDRLEMTARAREIPLATENFALPGFLGRMFVEDFSGQLTVDARAVFEFREESVLTGSLRASVTDARLHPSALDTWLEDVSLDFEATLDPPPGVDLWHNTSWTATAKAQANCYGSPFTAWGEVGSEVPHDAWVQGWCRAESLQIHRSVLENLGITDYEVWDAFAPRGVMDTSVEFLARPADTPTGWARELAVHLRPRAGTGLTFHGFPDRQEELRGFPLPIEEFSGQTWITFDETRPRPWRAAAFDLIAKTGNGEVSGWAQFSAATEDEDAENTEFDLFLTADKVTVNDDLAVAMQGNPATRYIWADYAPSGGTLSAQWRLRAGPETAGLTGAGNVQVHGAQVRWSELPVPLENVDGELSFVWGAKPTLLAEEGRVWRSFGVEYHFQNDQTEHSGAKARLRGFAREEPIFAGTRLDSMPQAWVQGLSVEIDELFLRGRNFHILADTFPTLGEQVESLGAVGRVGVRYYGSRAHPELPFRSDIEAWPEEVEVTPSFFKKRVPEINGRLCLQTWQESEEEARTESVLSFLGTWPGGAELAARGTIPARGSALLNFYGAGIDPSDPALRGAFLAAMSGNNDGEPGIAIDLSGQRLFGPIDIAATSLFNPDSSAPPVNTYRVFLRDNQLENDRVTLEGMHGVFTQSEGIFSSDQLGGRLGGHEIAMRNVNMFPLSKASVFDRADPLLKRTGFWTDPFGFALQADLFIDDIPLSALVPGVSGTQEDSGVALAGYVDIPWAHVIVTWELGGDGKVALRGPVKAWGLELGGGFPIDITYAKLDIDEFVLEEGRVRGWGKVDNLSAQIAGRALNQASMIVGYVDKRLTIDNLSGQFEGGELKSLGSRDSVGPRKALGIDLAPPHRFDVALRLSKVHIDKLLRSVFRSSIADEGFLDAELQLSGTPGDVLGMAGRGTIYLEEGRLWSIPVIRDLFRQLGFDKTGVFDRLNARFSLRKGVIDISMLEIRSALLNLIGKGFQDLDGRLSYDLEVRYSLLEGSSIVHRLIYWLNNSLFRVGVRGDFSRPQITVRNSLLELLGGKFDKHPDRHLPLPSFSDVGKRF
ncbi:MAG: hypothetical protein CMJ89_19340 [Planctomycetes bacterium]|nr:hypothetical protein [Planctomycetota bacterium]